MPSLTFVMPHWLYWAGLLLFPLMAIYLVRRQLRKPLPPGPSFFIAYLFWLTAGFLGIHRFYLRSAYGFVFIPVFLFILYCNAEVRDVRDDTSRTFAALESAQHTVADHPSPTRRTRRRRPPPHLIAHRPTSRSTRPNTTRRRPSPITGCRSDATARSCWPSFSWSMRYCCRASCAQSVARWKKRHRIARSPSPKPHRSSPSPWLRKIRRSASIRGSPMPSSG